MISNKTYCKCSQKKIAFVFWVSRPSQMFLLSGKRNGWDNSLQNETNDGCEARKLIELLFLVSDKKWNVWAHIAVFPNIGDLTNLNLWHCWDIFYYNFLLFNYNADMTIACTVSFTSKHVKAFYDGFLVFIGNDKCLQPLLPNRYLHTSWIKKTRASQHLQSINSSKLLLVILASDLVVYASIHYLSGYKRRCLLWSVALQSTVIKRMKIKLFFVCSNFLSTGTMKDIIKTHW